MRQCTCKQGRSGGEVQGSGLPLATAWKFQLVQIAAVPMLVGPSNITGTIILRELHCPPIALSTQFKVLGLIFEELNGLGYQGI